ncbi:MAG: hypothetical protein M3Q15_01705 [Pseudomonadota bacterium]|nr:hypothetical protein [Pseudomonadota bacterium]
MANDVHASGGRRGIPWRMIGWSIPVLLLLLPLGAMQFTNEVVWTASDFVFAAVLFGSVGLAFEVIMRKSSSLAYRSGAALAVITAFLTIWVNAAVGMIGDGAFNLLFGGVLFVALIGAVMARLESSGMARAMVAAAIVQGILSAIGFSMDPRGGIFSMAFAGLWLLAAALFRNAARSQVAGHAAP